MLDSSSFTGFIYSKIKFSSQNKRWEIVRITDENEVLAYMDKSDEHFPTGTHHWYFEDVQCTDPGEKWRSLNLHMDVKKPENFCCHDGTCISSEFVCNNFADCEDKTDEHQCNFLHFREYGNITDRPPTEFEFGKKKLLAVNVSFIVLKLFEINDVEGTFDIHFMVHVEWFDKDLQFEYLKENYEENSLSSKLYKQIWIPNIVFDDVDINSDMVVYEKTVFVKRKKTPVVSGEVDKIDVRELYDGRDNPLNIDFEKRIKFTCSFDNIQNYPFGMQVSQVTVRHCNRRNENKHSRTAACTTTSLGLTTFSPSLIQWSWWTKARRSLVSISSSSGK